MKILLDTTVLIDLLKGEENALKMINILTKDNTTMYTCSLNIYEVLRGIKLLTGNKEVHLKALKTVEQNIYILPFNLETTETASDIYVELRNKGKTIDAIDYLIAGCCRSNNIHTILTRNEKHFSLVKGIKVMTY